ncbi:Nucleoside-diphosphate-sugar epimerase [Flavobacterium fluvii]|uniref:Nucleoside-diphosphate-sugar epimerase n=1 Tax=Flavobacterium fluvii TaxID=468056 RepID=A0A1M5F9A6_9FLAO|nr:SDR family oxidoreductase [Flavobacterium fluvii]SHF87641.1 Nucleoside-diphosphate-sugar epimerase [Flavobacterium fluvii]
MTQISILGCGWLGLPLAKALLANGFSVKGSTTSNEKISVLENSGIKPFLIALSEDKTKGKLDDFLENSKILIIDVPPKLRGPEKENFVSKIKNLIPFIEKSSVENVLFISSTAVYGDTSSALSVTEETKTCPETESGRQLLEAEQLLQSNPNFKTTILRFGGLIGEDRHPIKFLAGKTNLDNPNAPINLIHQEDCIGIILEILRQAQNDKLLWNEIFNAVTPFHPSRKEYYTQKAVDLNLSLPYFNPEITTFGKTISSSKIETVLGYTFTKPNL